MHNTYISSTVMSIRGKGSLSFSFNDYPTSLNGRYNATHSQSSPCCSCSCSCCHASISSNNRLPMSPSIFHGSRQSTLIQLSNYRRRLILGGWDRYIYRFPTHYDFGRECYEVSCSINGSYGGESESVRVKKGKKERYHKFGGVDDVEAVLSLLSDEISSGKEGRSEKPFGRMDVENRQSYGSELYRSDRKQAGVHRGGDSQTGNIKKVVVERRVNSGGECFEGGKDRVERKQKYGDESYNVPKKNMRLSLGERMSRNEYESVDEAYRRNEDRNATSRGKKGSSCSSYYSIENETDVHDENDKLLEDLSSGYKEDSNRNRNEEDRFEGKFAREFRRREENLEHKYNSAEVSHGESEYRKGTSEMRRDVVRKHGIDYGEASTSRRQSEEEESTWAVSLDEKTKNQYAQGGFQPESRRNRQDVTEVQDVHGSDVEMLSQSQKQFVEREENTMVSVESDRKTRSQYRQTLGRDTTNNVKTSKILNAGDRIQLSNEQEQQTGETMIKQTDLRKPERVPVKSNTQFTEDRKTSLFQSRNRIRSQGKQFSLVSSSQPEVEEQHQVPSKKTVNVIQSRKESLDQSSSTSVSHIGEMITATESRKTSENRKIGEKSSTTSAVKPSEETTERYKRSDEGVVRTNVRNEAKKSTELISSHERASTYQASLSWTSEKTSQQINLKEGGQRSSHSIRIPPPPYFVDSGPGDANVISETVSQEVLSETSESESDALRTRPRRRSSNRRDAAEEPLSLSIHDDTLGSVQRLEQSSMQLIGEFFEKATSEMGKEKTTSDTNVVSEADLKAPEISSRYESEDSQLKQYNPTWSSGGSGRKGPSDEIWDVKGPSASGVHDEEASGGTIATGSSVVKRNGKSFWSIMSDIVRLRWNSRSGTANSVVRSGGKSSPNESGNSEAWFSGHEPDVDENAKRKMKNVLQEATSLHQLEVGPSSSQNLIQPSDSLRPTDTLERNEGNIASSSGLLEHRLPTKDFSSSEENVNWNTDGPTDVVPLSLPLPPLGMRRSHSVEVESRTGQVDVSPGGSMQRLEQPITAKVVEESEFLKKDAELKQKKFQRNKQVPRDRFDDWEQAYKLEAEQREIDEMFMREALIEAKKAAESWEVPVGAVLVQHGKIIARGCNLVEELRDSTAHAEMICIREASSLLRSWRLADATLYVTLEPCPMCAGAILQARIDTLVWGAPNKLLGADGSWIRLFPDGGGSGSENPTDKPPPPLHPFHPKMTIRRGVLASECAGEMQQFFQLRRKKKKPASPPPPPPASCLPIANHPSKILAKMHNVFNVMFCL